MCGRVICKDPFMLEYCLDKYCYKNQQMCDKAVGNYPHALKFVPDCHITQKLCDKAVNLHHSTIQFVPNCYKTQKICDQAVDD